MGGGRPLLYWEALSKKKGYFNNRFNQFIKSVSQKSGQSSLQSGDSQKATD